MIYLIVYKVSIFKAIVDKCNSIIILCVVEVFESYLAQHSNERNDCTKKAQIADVLYSEQRSGDNAFISLLICIFFSNV